MMKDNMKNTSGFTLVETLVGIFVITTALAAAFTAAQSSLKSSVRAYDQTTAFYLAQEGFELIKNVRDSNVQERNSDEDYWFNRLDLCTGADRCQISAFSGGSPKDTISRCNPDSGGCVLDQNDNGHYGHNVGGESSRFKRYFTVKLPSGDETNDEIRVDMTIEWRQGADELSFETTEFISNWRF